ncbi:MAG: hypothetical protein R3E31_05410 [Chloroflexota bacterium]
MSFGVSARISPAAALYGRALRIGLWLGLAMMSRQWAIFLVTAVAVVIAEIWVYARAKSGAGECAFFTWSACICHFGALWR